ncbi:DUF4435 domain-containing protein [Bacillus sp. WC2507]|uniref:DUF4435 domain-containing protein n=1 Tax=Bacillus sp. WC2507 TaxID=3461404 RepID=UPI00404382A9
MKMSANSDGVVDRLELMRGKKVENVVGKHRIMSKFFKNKTSPFCIVEGEDEKYYKIRVKMGCSNKEPIFIPCGGKRKVLETYEWIKSKSEYKEGKFMFFVDRDFDELQNNHSIYETPFHSVENFYTTEDSLKNILRSTFKLDEDTGNYVFALKLYKKRQSEFHESIKLLNAWIMCQNDLAKQGKISKLNLKNVKIEDYVSIKMSAVLPKYTLEIFDVKFPHAHKVTNEDIKKKLNQIEGSNYQQLFRGKFEIQFLRKFLDLIREDLCKPTPQHFPEKKKVNLNVYDVVAQFSSDATTTDCLYNYINRIWLESGVAV